MRPPTALNTGYVAKESAFAWYLVFPDEEARYAAPTRGLFVFPGRRLLDTVNSPLYKTG